jgi:hypothetical protein
MKKIVVVAVIALALSGVVQARARRTGAGRMRADPQAGRGRCEQHGRTGSGGTGHPIQVDPDRALDLWTDGCRRASP